MSIQHKNDKIKISFKIERIKAKIQFFFSSIFVSVFKIVNLFKKKKKNRIHLGFETKANQCNIITPQVSLSNFITLLYNSTTIPTLNQHTLCPIKDFSVTLTPKPNNQFHTVHGTPTAKKP